MWVWKSQVFGGETWRQEPYLAVPFLSSRGCGREEEAHQEVPFFSSTSVVEKKPTWKHRAFFPISGREEAHLEVALLFGCIAAIETILFRETMPFLVF